MKQTTLPNSILNIILVFIESALTLILRLDPALRKAAYPLAKRGVVVCFRLYLPHVEVYATFSYKGILLDAQMPIGRSEPDVIINAYSMQVFKVITTHDEQDVQKLQMRGNAEQVAWVKNFLRQLGVMSLVKSVLSRFKKSDKNTKTSDSNEQKEDYKQRIQEQQTQINTLTIKNRELETTVKEFESKQKTLTIALAVAVVVALAAMIGWLMS